MKPSWIARNALAVTATVVMAAPLLLRANDTTLDNLQQEWRRIFPPLTSHDDPLASVGLDDAYRIVQKEFLLIRPGEHTSAGLFRSWDAIRAYPSPIRRAHAACVKIVTPSWHGSGVVISPGGDILTSYHLVADVPGACVMTLDGRVYSVTNILAFSAVHDLALLHIPAETPVYLPVDQGKEASPGSLLSVVGHPGETSWKLTSGTAIRQHSESGTTLLHFDSDIGHGNSGGPVIDEEGRLCAITACAAQLADGSQVKAGIDISAVRKFLQDDRTPVSFEELSHIARNRAMADFLSTLCVVMEAWMRQWLEAMASVTVTPKGETTTHASLFALGNTKAAAEASLKLILLRALISRCSQVEGLDPWLYQSMQDTSETVDSLIDGMVSLRSVMSALSLKTTLAELETQRSGAVTSFARALGGLDKAGHSRSLQLARQQTIHDLCEAYAAVPGCHVQVAFTTAERPR